MIQKNTLPNRTCPTDSYTCPRLSGSGICQARPVMLGFDVSFAFSMYMLNKQASGWWFENHDAYVTVL